MHLRAKAENRSTQAAIASLAVPSSKLGSVTLENVADFEPGTSPTDINRQARQRQVTVFCNLLPDRVTGRDPDRDARGVQQAEHQR